jgi:hypothetical protein
MGQRMATTPPRIRSCTFRPGAVLVLHQVPGGDRAVDPVLLLGTSIMTTYQPINLPCTCQPHGRCGHTIEGVTVPSVAMVCPMMVPPSDRT